jgi:hypothetical protein
MAVLSDNSTIQDFINQTTNKLKNTIESYDYKQLRDDFSEDDVKNIAQKFQIEEISIDEASIKKTPSQGTGEIYNPEYQFFNQGPKYVTVQGKWLKFEIPLLAGSDVIQLGILEDPFTRAFECERQYEEMDYSTWDKTISFSLFFSDSELKDKTKEQIAGIVNGEAKKYTDSLDGRISKMNSIVRNFNAGLPAKIHELMNEKITRDTSMDVFSDALGISITSKNGSQEKGKPIVITPKKVDINLPERKKYEGYYIGENDYSAIISTIRNHLIATETLPKAIEKLNDEELIRDTILWSLNANYIVATGETFRNQGKSDICINFKEKSAFIAECKVWRGEKYISDAIDQLLSYTTWRDSKAAVIVFNLEAQDFKSLCAKLKEIATSHHGYKQTLSSRSQNEFECAFRDPNDPESTISITFFAANYVIR